MWVALTENYFFGVVSQPGLQRGISLAIEELKNAGMTSELYVGVVHGISGKFIFSKRSKKIEKKHLWLFT